MKDQSFNWTESHAVEQDFTIANSITKHVFPHLCSCLTVILIPRIELRALGKIAEGEELTVAYVDFLNLSEERQRLLKTQYFFDCTCEDCKNRIKDDMKIGGREEDGVKVSVRLSPV